MQSIAVHKFKFKSHKYRNDPWSVFGQMVEQGPLIRIKMPILGTSWAATSYEAVNAVFKNDEQFVRDPKSAGRKTIIGWQWMLPKSLLALVHNMLGADGQNHRRLRSLVDKAFARRNIEGMSDRMQDLADQQLDLVQQAADSTGRVDLIQHYARPFPLTVICELLGLPSEDREKFREWFEPFSTVNSILGIFALGRGVKKITRYLKSQIEEVGKNPRPGLLTELVQLEHEGDKLNEKELLSMIFLLLVAGHETTVHLINNALLTLLQHPDAKQELLSDESKWNSAIDECLRYCSPLQMGKPRYIAKDMEFHGHLLKRGEMITPIIASANYDPQQFECPDQFDINRTPNYHMSFGSGPHTCLGMKLARTETQIAIQSLFDRWPKLSAAFDLNNPDWSRRPGTRSMNSFFVQLS